MPRLSETSAIPLPADSQVILICDAAAALHVTRRTLLKKLRENGLPIVHFSSRWRGVRISDLNRLIDAHLQPTAQRAIAS
jgi:hypothetical protein